MRRGATAIEWNALAIHRYEHKIFIDADSHYAVGITASVSRARTVAGSAGQQDF